jgi:hypothetical protein
MITFFKPTADINGQQAEDLLAEIQEQDSKPLPQDPYLQPSPTHAQVIQRRLLMVTLF